MSEPKIRNDDSQEEDSHFPTTIEKTILKLDAENYKKKLKNTEHLFIFFYSPFCRYSLSLASELVKVSTFLKNFDSTKSTVIAQFNVNKDKETASEFHVEGTPVFRYYRKGELKRVYEDSRTSVGVFNFILSNISSSHSLEITTKLQLEALNSFHDHTLIYFGDEDNLGSFHKTIETISDQVLYGHVIEDSKSQEKLEIVKSFKNRDEVEEEGQTVVVLFENNKEKARYHPKSNDETHDFSKINEFLSVNLYESILLFDDKTSKLIFSQGKPALFFYSSPKEHQKYRDFINEELPKSIREKILIILLGSEENENLEGRLYSVVSASYKDFPSVKIHQRVEKLMTQNMKGEITKENVIGFVERWFSNGFIEEVKEETEEEEIKDDL